MKIKEVKAKVVFDSRGERTIEVSVNGLKTSAPSGKSKGRHEKPAFRTSPAEEKIFINSLKIKDLPKIKKFDDLKKIEKAVKNKIGANTLFSLEASILKALAKEQKKELWQMLGGRKIPKLISNIIGGGAHSRGAKKPDFQEFLVIGSRRKNLKAYLETKKILKAKSVNDENAWRTQLENEEILEIMKFAKLKIGIDAAASQFYKNRKYYYKNPADVMTRNEQIEYIIALIKNYRLYYVEDPLYEEDFRGFAEIKRKTRCILAGDDLTVTNLKRVKRAIAMKSVSGVIIKPNQTGSLLEVKKVIDLCRQKDIKTIMSHRSGETSDDTIADLAVAWGCDFLKIPVAGRERLAKVERLEEIKRRLR